MKNKFTILGCGSSLGSPWITGYWGNCRSNNKKNVRTRSCAHFYYKNMSPQYQWDTIVHCGDTVNFDFIANDYDYYPNGSRQDLLFEISGGQFYDYLNNQSCHNPPCATFEEIGSGSVPPFIASGGSGGGEFNWITDCSHLLNPCNTQTPSIFSFVIKASPQSGFLLIKLLLEIK